MNSNSTRLFSHYFENQGWNIYEEDGTPVGCLSENAVELDNPDGFDPDVFPYEDSDGFIPGELFGADHQTAH